MSTPDFPQCDDRQQESRAASSSAEPERPAAAPLFAGAVGVAAEGRPAAACADGKRKIKLGLVGCGGRGSWIAGLFKQDRRLRDARRGRLLPGSGRQVRRRAWAWPRGDASRACRATRRCSKAAWKPWPWKCRPASSPRWPPPPSRRAYTSTWPSRWRSTCHGCLRIEAAGKQATQKQQVFFVDYQIPTDPFNIEVAKRIHSDAMGPLAKIVTVGVSGGYGDPPKTATLESRLQNSVWASDVALGGDWIVAFDIHAIDAALWAAGQRPVAATGVSRICRSNPHGDARDVCDVDLRVRRRAGA